MVEGHFELAVCCVGMWQGGLDDRRADGFIEEAVLGVGVACRSIV